ncbi:MAG: alpha/beta fold hydrolase [Methylococcaceae bacterium]|nr:alpha/beta fold hydrolase [Methylococcaceae bacterium]
MLGLLLTLACLILALYLAQRQFIYFPAQQDLAQAEREAQRSGLEPWLIDGRFVGWRAPPGTSQASASLLVFHGNAGAASQRHHFRDLFQKIALDPEFDVYLLEYPGYGPRPGSPSEQTLLQAADEAIERLHRQGPLFLVGESLGSAVAALAGARRTDEVQGMLLITPFTNLFAVARHYYPLLPNGFLRDGYRADQALEHFPGPVAFLIAGHDTVIPPALGQKLFDGFSGRKSLWIDQDADHNSLDYDPSHPRWREIVRFLLKP